MKKVLICLLVLLLLAGAAAGGFWWYRETHIFVEDAVYAKDSTLLDLREENISLSHFEAVQSQLPQCRILWSVPFQGTTCSSDTTTLTVDTWSAEDAKMLPYFPDLTTVNAEACQDYTALEQLKAEYPDLTVTYYVDLGGIQVAPDVTELTLNEGEYRYDVLMENLSHLPGVQSILLPKTSLTLEQMAALSETREGMTVDYTVSLLGAELVSGLSALDLSAITPDQVAEATAAFAMLPSLTNVELMTAEGTSQLSLTDVKALQDAAPQASFHYSFDLYGYTLTTTDTQVHIKNTHIGDDGLTQVRQALDILENCERFVLEHCSISNEAMAQLREDYRDKTKVVWRVYFGQGTSLTDAEIIRSTYNLTGSNCHDLIYCEDVRYMDIGHNESLTSVEFVAGMPNLEMIIVSGAPIRDLTPFENCKKLKILELAFCGLVEDISPLAGCESLEMLNIAATQVTDLSALDNLNITMLCARSGSDTRARIPQEEQDRFNALHPDCWSTYKGEQPYGQGWRYDREDQRLPWYDHIADVFGYPNPYNNVGWYLDD